MFIKDGTYRDVSIAGLTAPIYEGTVLTESGAIAKEDGSDAFGIVPENIYIMPPTKMTRVAIGGAIDLQDPANAHVTISKAIQDALSADINFIPGAGALPVVDAEDDGKILVVEEGKWSAGGSEVIKNAVGDWLDAHPEATTTVQDGSVTDAKLAQAGGVLSEVHDVRVGVDGVTYASAGAAVREQISAINSFLYNTRIPLYPYQFIGNAYVNGSVSVSNNNYAIATVNRLLFRNLGAVHIYTTDSNLKFDWRKASANTMQAETQDLYYDGSEGIWMNIMTVDQSAVKASDLNSIYIMTSKEVYDQFVVDNFNVQEHSHRFGEYNDGSDTFARYGMYETADQLGFLMRSRNYYRTSIKPMISDKACTIFCPTYSSNSTVIKILHDGALHSIPCGGFYTVPAKTAFGFSVQSNNQSGTNPMLTYVCIAVDGTYFEPVEESGTVYDILTQYLSSTAITRNDTSFMVDGKIFMISRETEQLYSVLENNVFLKSNAALPHTAGHANSCNYDNGYVYVSDWTDNTLIHVFAVDSANNTLTYSKDIVLPATEYGSMEYYVQNDEKEIFFLGWQTGNAATENNNLIYGLYILTDDGYVLSYVKKALRINILQGFTIQNGYIYAIECTGDSYNTTGIIRINIGTGESRKYVIDSGTLNSNEAEAIIPVGTGTFLLTDVRGKLYVAMVAE